jgi:hypothetical protein
VRLLARIATAAAGVLIGLGLAEALLSPWPPALTSSWILATRDRVRDPDLIYVNPRLERRSYYTVDPLLPTIVALGDSFTEGFPVDRARSYPSALRRMLASRGQRTNVVSLGLGDSGPDQQLRLFQRNVLERGWIRPDVVVWQLYNNDAWDNALKSVYAIAAQGLEPVPAARNWMYRRQLLFDRTPLPRWFKLHSNIFGYALKSIEHWRLAQVPEAYAADPQGWGLEKIRLELHALDELGKAHGFRSYYTVVPPQSSYANASDCAASWTERRRCRNTPNCVPWSPPCRGTSTSISAMTARGRAAGVSTWTVRATSASSATAI